MKKLVFVISLPFIFVGFIGKLAISGVLIGACIFDIWWDSLE